MRRVLHYLNERGRRHHWSVRAVRWLLLISSLAMGVAAATSESDHHIMADGTKARPAQEPSGDPGGKPVDDVGQRTDAGAKSDPDSDANDLSESGVDSR